MMARVGKVVAIIPARGGSKGLPGKNILPLLGKPVLAYTAEAARQATTLDRIILSTDSEEIAQAGKEWGLEVPFLRPDHLATDTAHPTAVIEHAVSFLEEQEGYQVDLLVTLQPTSPLRCSHHIDQTVRLVQEQPEFDSAITVAEVEVPPFWMFKRHGDLLQPFVDDGVNYSLRRRQELEQLYRQNGAVYVTRRWLLKDQGILFSAYGGGSTGYLLMDQISSLDIDTKADFLVIESVLKSQAK